MRAPVNPSPTAAAAPDVARRPGRRRCLVAAAVMAVVAGTQVLPAAAAPGPPAAGPGTGPAAAAVGEVEDAPAAGAPAPAGPGGGAAQEAAPQDPVAIAARAELDRAVAAAQVELDAQSAAAAAALEAYQGAVRARDAADLAHDQEVARLAGAREHEQRSDQEVARWTSQAYRHGVAGGDVAELMAVVDAGGPSELRQRLTGLRQVGRAESRDLLDARDARSDAQVAVRVSAGTAATAGRAAEQAEVARRSADEQVAALGEKVAALAAARAGGDGAGTVASGPSGLGAPGAWASLPGCTGDDLGAYANGAVPPGALCPVPGARGEVLRSDAASAFAAMSTAYAAEHGGQRLCVTDAYRDLASQVAVRAARPGLAAVPGTSEHGWGVAVDLCGGVQDASSPASAWMRAHSGLYGWFHPAWAQVGGALPEAWHWEFAG